MLKNKKYLFIPVIILLPVLFVYSYFVPNLSNMKHKSFLINVDKETVRLEDMKKRFSDADIDFERFSASSPKDVILEYKDSETGEIKKITAERIGEIKKWENVKVSCSENNEVYINVNHWGTESKVYPGQLGCWCSHRLLWQKILDDDLDYAIIFEDDAVFTKYSKSKIELLFNYLPADYEILIFHEHFTKVPSQFMKYFNPFLKRYNGRGFCGLEGYIVSKKGAKELLEITKLSDRPIDNQMELLMQNGNTYTSRFSIFTPLAEQVSRFGSTIIPVQK